MLKKFFVALFLGLTISFAGVQNQAFAGPLAYIAEVPDTDMQCYAVMDSIRKHYDGDILIIEATFKYGAPGGKEFYVDYTFGAPYGQADHAKYQNSYGANDFVSPDETPLEWAMLIFLLQNG